MSAYPITKTTLLTAIYSSDEVSEVLTNIHPNKRDDVRQEVFECLLNKEEAEIIGLHERGKLRPYIVKTLYNTANLERSSHNYQNRRRTEIPTETFVDTADVLEEMDYEELLNTCAVRVDQLYHYHQHLLKLYVEKGSMRAVAFATGIPLNSVCRAINAAREEVKRQLWE